MISELLLWKEARGGDRGLLWDSIPAFAWREEETHEKPLLR
jgi:hypothetical protein